MTGDHSPNVASQWALALLILAVGTDSRSAEIGDNRSAIRALPSAAPHINGPSVFGVRPGSPFLYTIPTVGDRPMNFSAERLPSGLAVDGASGRITGSLRRRGEYPILLRARNALGTDTKHFRIE